MSLCLVASYPKSGNTWMRALLTALRSRSEINDLDGLDGSNRFADPLWLNPEIGVDATMLTIDQLDIARSELYRRRNAVGVGLEFEKTHLVNRKLGGRRLFDATSGRAIYLVRHPFDVAVSYSHFVGLSPDEIVTQMLNVEAAIDRPGDGRRHLLPQFMSSWSQHVQSWAAPGDIPTLLVRYEDLLGDATAELTRVSDFLGLDAQPDAIAAAVVSAGFDRLRCLESSSGFELSPRTDQKFFRSGRSGDGAEQLSSDQRSRITAAAHVQMNRLGYSADGSTATLSR